MIVRNYRSGQRWVADAPPATPTCPAGGEEIGPQALAGQSWVLQCWIWAPLPGCFPWCACLLSWLGTCARPEHAPKQRTCQDTGPGEWEGTKEEKRSLFENIFRTNIKAYVEKKQVLFHTTKQPKKLWNKKNGEEERSDNKLVSTFVKVALSGWNH